MLTCIWDDPVKLYYCHWQRKTDYFSWTLLNNIRNPFLISVILCHIPRNVSICYIEEINLEQDWQLGSPYDYVFDNTYTFSRTHRHVQKPTNYYMEKYKNHHLPFFQFVTVPMLSKYSSCVAFHLILYLHFEDIDTSLTFTWPFITLDTALFVRKPKWIFYLLPRMSISTLLSEMNDVWITTGLTLKRS